MFSNTHNSKKTVENQSNHNNVLYVVFYYPSNDTSGFAKNESEISPFLTMIILYENLNKNVLAGAHKKSERVQHTEIYLLGLKVQYKHKTKLPFDMVSKHVPLSVQRPY